MLSEVALGNKAQIPNSLKIKVLKEVFQPKREALSKMLESL